MYYALSYVRDKLIGKILLDQRKTSLVMINLFRTLDVVGVYSHANMSISPKEGLIFGRCIQTTCGCEYVIIIWILSVNISRPKGRLCLHDYCQYLIATIRLPITVSVIVQR